MTTVELASARRRSIRFGPNLTCLTRFCDFSVPDVSVIERFFMDAGENRLFSFIITHADEDVTRLLGPVYQLLYFFDLQGGLTMVRAVQRHPLVLTFSAASDLVIFGLSRRRFLRMFFIRSDNACSLFLWCVHF